MRARTRPSLLALSALVAGVLSGTAPAHAVTVDEVYERPADGVYVVDGHGWGHGRGMSQYGALGAAGSGVGFTEILNFYYPGTGQIASATGDIRVLLNADEGVDLVVAAFAGLSVTDLATGNRYPLPVDPLITRWRFALAADSTMRVQSSGDGKTWANYAPGGISGFAGALQFDGGPIQIYLPDNTRRDYRGAMRAIRISPTTIASVNYVTLEDYLKGVVPRESPAWFHPEALKAQAVAARSYSAYKRAHIPAASQVDICDTTQCQVYGGARLYLDASGGRVVELENPATTAAVEATTAIVRTWKDGPIFAEFSASNGGFSVQGGTTPYLVAKADPYSGLDKRDTVHAWTARVPVTALETAYPAVGRLARVRITSRDGNGEWGGRALGVVLEGTNAAGAATSVTTDGNTFYNAYDWPGRADGMRSRWWRIRPVYDATLAVRSPDPTLVRAPAFNAPSYVDIVNSGATPWDPAALHFAVAGNAADPYTAGDTTPGGFILNVTTNDNSTVLPGHTARLQLPWNIGPVKAGVYTATYRLMHGSSQFGPTVSWKLIVVEPIFGAAVAGVATLAPAGATPAFSPQPVAADGTVAVARTGRTAVRLQFRNTGNIAWPVGGQVRLATSAARNRLSGSSGPGWLTRNRAAAISSVAEDATASSVAPGQTANIDFTIHGNGRPAGSSVESFELVWEAHSWLPKSAVTVSVARIDTTVSRVAELVTAPSAAVRLIDYPRGTTTLTLRARNLGANAWRVGGTDVLGVSAAGGAALRSPGWLTATRTTRLTNAAGGADGLVHPGEIGEWRVPISAFRKRPGVFTAALQPVNMTSRVAYGPKTSSTVTIVPGVMRGTLVQATQNAVVPRAGERVVFLDVRNTGNVAWPVASSVRTAAVQSGGSLSRHASWLSPTRPGSVSFNATRRTAREVRPGEVARLSFRIGGNNRKPGVYSEPISVLWDGWRSALKSPVTLRYIIR